MKAVYICADQPVTFTFRLRRGGGPYIRRSTPRSRGVLWPIIPPAFSAVFQGSQTESPGEDLRGHNGQCAEDTNLGGVDRHAVDQISATEIHLRLVVVESGGAVASAVVRLPRLVGLDLSPFQAPEPPESLPEQLAMVWQ